MYPLSRDFSSPHELQNSQSHRPAIQLLLLSLYTPEPLWHRFIDIFVLSKTKNYRPINYCHMEKLFKCCCSSAFFSSCLIMLLVLAQADQEASLQKIMSREYDDNVEYYWPMTTMSTSQYGGGSGEMDDDGAGGGLSRRSLFWNRFKHIYISYGALSSNRIPCPPRSGRSYYTHNCYFATGPVHPYVRGCSTITRCRR